MGNQESSGLFFFSQTLLWMYASPTNQNLLKQVGRGSGFIPLNKTAHPNQVAQLQRYTHICPHRLDVR